MWEGFYGKKKSFDKKFTQKSPNFWLYGLKLSWEGQKSIAVSSFLRALCKVLFGAPIWGNSSMMFTCGDPFICQTPAELANINLNVASRGSRAAHLDHSCGEGANTPQKFWISDFIRLHKQIVSIVASVESQHISEAHILHTEALKWNQT